MADGFRLTEDHLKLLRRANVGWEACEYGAPAIDCKRPFGNSAVEADIIDILGWEAPADEGDEEGWESLRRDARAVYGGLQNALAIVLRFAGEAVTPGLYRLHKPYDYRSWKRVGD